MSKITAEEFLALCDEDTGGPKGSKRVAKDESTEHKTCYTETTYSYGEQFFTVVESRSNSGYWGDAERYAPECIEVELKQVTVARYFKV